MVEAMGKCLTFSACVRSECPPSICSSGSPSDGSNNQTASGEGFPETGLTALLSGDLTEADSPTTDNSLGLNVE